ncbi:carbonic anhydrase 7-like isoform X2 [Sipha flava]|uniref:Carbonic anhydrase n=1 Tax=Sipha flava TaxID=143950 RepID=A0A8B8F790_9HEMI|nr:carbonic anhydrase 7-like isoform X2 [Sipha flava]
MYFSYLMVWKFVMWFILSLSATSKSVDIEFPEGTLNIPEITGGPLLNIYQFKQIHFHWGQGDEGSEHEIDGKRYAMELHIVFFNEILKSYDEAIKSPTGLTVISILGQISSENNTDLDAFIGDLQQLSSPNSEIRKNFISQFSWINNSISHNYYSYHGSLTTPPHSGSIIWILMTNVFNISSTQMGEFRHLHSKTGDKCIDSNFRTLQDLNGRTIYYSP